MLSWLKDFWTQPLRAYRDYVLVVMIAVIAGFVSATIEMAGGRVIDGALYASAALFLGTSLLDIRFMRWPLLLWTALTLALTTWCVTSYVNPDPVGRILDIAAWPALVVVVHWARMTALGQLVPSAHEIVPVPPPIYFERG